MDTGHARDIAASVCAGWQAVDLIFQVHPNNSGGTPRFTYVAYM